VTPPTLSRPRPRAAPPHAARRAALILGPLVGLLGAAGSLAALLAARLVGVPRHRRYPHRLLSVENDRVVLGRNQETERPGIYGLSSARAHVVIGPPESLTDKAVVRPIERVDFGTLLPGPVALDHVHVGDPRSALGLDFQDLSLSGDTGPLPAWIIPGGDTWVIVAHGLGGSRASSLSFLSGLHQGGHSVLVASYRNDPGAGPSHDRLQHLGDEEWRDLDTAMAYALAHGARSLALFGWSLGGAVVLQALARSPRAGAVAGVILDSPVLDWRSVLHHVGRRSRAPRPLVHLVARLVERRIGIDLDHFDWLHRHEELAVPILVFHGETDATVPFHTTAALARRRPDLLQLVVVPGAGHVGSWNVDPAAHVQRINQFLASVFPPGSPGPEPGLLQAGRQGALAFPRQAPGPLDGLATGNSHPPPLG